MERQTFHKPDEIFKEVAEKLDQAASRDERVDYLSFVPDGEPTLDINLGRMIPHLRREGIPVAVFTNSSLIWQEDVQEDLLKADFVSLKVDTVSQDLWRRKNRPHAKLELRAILEGITAFVNEFRGTVVSETMLLDGIDRKDEVEKIAVFLADLRRLDKAYIAVPTKPPAQRWVRPAKKEMIDSAYQLFSERLGTDRVECLTGYEGDSFAFTGRVEEDLLGIMAVHPMRKEAVLKFLEKANTNWCLVEKLLDEGRLVDLEYEGNTYYMKKLASRR